MTIPCADADVKQINKIECDMVLSGQSISTILWGFVK